MNDDGTDRPTVDGAPRPATRRSSLGMLPAALGLGLVLAWFWRGRPDAAEPEPLPVKGQVTAFTLLNAAGEPVTQEDLRGDIWIADFIFSRCAGQCLDMTARMAELHGALASDANVRFVSISVDPAYDTPQVLANYAQRQGAEADNWMFLTGSEDAVRNLVQQGFHLAAEEATPEQMMHGADLILHSIKFVLVDAQGRIRGYYSSQDGGALHRLVADTRRLARGPAS